MHRNLPDIMKTLHHEWENHGRETRNLQHDFPKTFEPFFFLFFSRKPLSSFILVHQALNTGYDPAQETSLRASRFERASEDEFLSVTGASALLAYGLSLLDFLPSCCMDRTCCNPRWGDGTREQQPAFTCKSLSSSRSTSPTPFATGSNSRQPISRLSSGMSTPSRVVAQRSYSNFPRITATQSRESTLSNCNVPHHLRTNFTSLNTRSLRTILTFNLSVKQWSFLFLFHM